MASLDVSIKYQQRIIVELMTVWYFAAYFPSVLRCQLYLRHCSFHCHINTHSFSYFYPNMFFALPFCLSHGFSEIRSVLCESHSSSTGKLCDVASDMLFSNIDGEFSIEPRIVTKTHVAALT